MTQFPETRTFEESEMEKWAKAWNSPLATLIEGVIFQNEYIAHFILITFLESSLVQISERRFHHFYQYTYILNSFLDHIFTVKLGADFRKKISSFLSVYIIILNSYTTKAASLFAGLQN